MADLMQTDIKFLTGVGPKRADLLNRELNIHTFEDLIYHFPYRYLDRTRFYKISEISSQQPYIQIRGRISSMQV
jgi:ATP-dependent DNA helicase RecG